MKKIAIVGAGDLGMQIAYHSLNDGHYTPVGFFDDFKAKDSTYFGLPVIGPVKCIIDEFKKGVFDEIIIGIGYQHFELRAQIFNQLVKHVPFANIIHSSSYVDSSAKLGVGIFIYPGCIVDMNVVLGNNVLLNVGCVIAHDTMIGAHSFLSPAVKIAGFVQVGERVNLGIGTIVIDNINIVDDVKTGGGSVVINNLIEKGLYVGLPAAFKKTLV